MAVEKIRKKFNEYVNHSRRVVKCSFDIYTGFLPMDHDDDDDELIARLNLSFLWIELCNILCLIKI